MRKKCLCLQSKISQNVKIQQLFPDSSRECSTNVLHGDERLLLSAGFVLSSCAASGEDVIRSDADVACPTKLGQMEQVTTVNTDPETEGKAKSR